MRNIIYQQPVYSYCGSGATSVCNGGTSYGQYLHVWQGTVVLPGPCANWVFSYSLCCRASSVNVVGQPTLFIESTLNNLQVPSNNSVYRNALLAPSSCVGQLNSYNPGFINPDGDSVVFVLESARSASTTFVSYNAGYSGAAPITGIAINAQTGIIDFSPSVLGSYLVDVAAYEYLPGGILKAKTLFEFNVTAFNCTPGNSNPIISTIQNY
jgi:hypothetical protein